MLKSTRNIKYSKISGDPAAHNLISRLKKSITIISTLRKYENNINKKVDAATKLVWSNCYDIGQVYAYCSDKIWAKVVITIKSVIKSAGLDHMTDSEVVFQVSTKISPKWMARKQIVQLGIKFLNPEQVIFDRYKVRRKPNDESRPFWFYFLTEFNSLPYDIRTFIINNLNVHNKASLSKIKHRLKKYYTNKCNLNGPLSKEKRTKLLCKNLYSREKINKRKRDYESSLDNRLLQGTLDNALKKSSIGHRTKRHRNILSSSENITTTAKKRPQKGIPRTTRKALMTLYPSVFVNR